MPELPIGEIICGDCLDIMRGWPDGCIDAVITSPPYDNLRDYKGYSFDFQPIARELYRIIKPGGVVVWVVGDATINGSETGTSFRQALYFMECGFRLHDTMIYEKDAMPFPSDCRYIQSFEYMFVLTKGAPNIVNLLKDRTNRQAGKPITGTSRNKDGNLIKMPTGKIKAESSVRSNVWLFGIGWGKSYTEQYVSAHPATFPIQLAQDHIASWTNPGDLVLDCFAGSGTTLAAAERLGRRWIGIDISEQYCAIARKRTAQKGLPL